MEMETTLKGLGLNLIVALHESSNQPTGITASNIRAVKMVTNDTQIRVSISDGNEVTNVTNLTEDP